MLSPVSAPFNNVPIDIIPESDGAKLINVPGIGYNLRERKEVFL